MQKKGPPPVPRNASEYDGADDYRARFAPKKSDPGAAVNAIALTVTMLMVWFAAGVFAHSLFDPKAMTSIGYFVGGVFSYVLVGPIVGGVYAFALSRVDSRGGYVACCAVALLLFLWALHVV